VESYQNTAAEMQMFGKLTRSIEDWYPSGLLCKRFNLKNPNVGKKKPEKKETLPLLASAELPIGIQPRDLISNQTMEQPKEDEFGPNQKEDLVDKEEEEEKIERPPIDFFKSIFEDDEDEEENEETNQEEGKKEEKMKENILPSTKSDVDLSITQKQTDQINHISIINKQPQKEEKKEETKQQTTTTDLNNEPNPYLYYPPKQDLRGGVLLEKMDEKTNKKEIGHYKENRKEENHHRDERRINKEKERHKDEKYRGDEERERDKRRNNEQGHHSHKRSRKD